MNLQVPHSNHNSGVRAGDRWLAQVSLHFAFSSMSGMVPGFRGEGQRTALMG